MDSPIGDGHMAIIKTPCEGVWWVGRTETGGQWGGMGWNGAEDKSVARVSLPGLGN
jgi:hypothetical protein